MTKSHNRVRKLLGVLLLAAASFTFGQTTTPAKVPTPQFQGEYFGEMGRAFGVIQEVDLKGRTLLMKRESDSKSVRVPIKDDTELRFRDSWGELSDYFPGQRVMLFMYVDENRNWTYPRAVQDEIQVSAAHGWFATVTKIDLTVGKESYATRREEKDKDGKVTKIIDREYVCTPTTIVHKSEVPTGIDGLQVGDEVIQQQIEKDGKLVVSEILDRKGDAAVRARQVEQHRKDQNAHGLDACVNDIEVLTGSLTITVNWSGADRAATLKPGDAVAINPSGNSPAFGAAIASTEHVDTRQRLHLAVNARVASRLSVGQSLHLFMPGTGPDVPAGKAGVPENAFR